MIFLRFPDEAGFIAASADYRDADGNLTIPNIDIIGTIAHGGTYDADGNVIDPPVAIEGYHANAIEIPANWQQYVIERPNNPYRIFAGA